jgi:hypothetical protein
MPLPTFRRPQPVSIHASFKIGASSKICTVAVNRLLVYGHSVISLVNPSDQHNDVFDFNIGQSLCHMRVLFSHIPRPIFIHGEMQLPSDKSATSTTSTTTSAEAEGVAVATR